jgi:translation elongation factor EF-Tu-like GTPase
MNNGKDIKVHIVETANKNELSNGIQKISLKSPLAISILGHTVGDILKVGNLDNFVEIIDVRNMEKKRDLIMVIDEVFFIIGRGVVALGTILNEKVEIGQKVIIDPEFLPEIETEIIDIESFRKKLKFAKINDNVGLYLKGLSKKQIKKKMKIYTI